MIEFPVAFTAECGDDTYRLTLCFPGSPQNATCSYILQANATGEEDTSHEPQKPCPKDLIFDQKCMSIPGTVFLALGPCNSLDVPEQQGADNSLDVAAWIDVMGLRTTQVSLHCAGAVIKTL